MDFYKFRIDIIGFESVDAIFAVLVIADITHICRF